MLALLSSHFQALGSYNVEIKVIRRKEDLHVSA